MILTPQQILFSLALPFALPLTQILSIFYFSSPSSPPNYTFHLTPPTLYFSDFSLYIIYNKMNRFQRCASNYAYYNYLNRYSPSTLREYQAERHYYLGRRGAYNNLVYKMASDHINYEEDFNLRYKIPPLVSNLSMRLISYWFIMSTIMISFSLGDMVKLFNPHEYSSPSRPNEDPEAVARYETLYMVDKVPKY